MHEGDERILFIRQALNNIPAREKTNCISRFEIACDLIINSYNLLDEIWKELSIAEKVSIAQALDEQGDAE